MISHHGLRVWMDRDATAAARVHDDGARHGRVGSPSAVPPHVRCLARHSAAGSLPALAGAPHPPMSPTAGAHWLHRRRHAVVVVASQSVRSVGEKNWGPSELHEAAMMSMQEQEPWFYMPGLTQRRCRIISRLDLLGLDGGGHYSLFGAYTHTDITRLQAA